VKALFDEELFGRIFDTTLSLLHHFGAKLGHQRTKRTFVFYKERGKCQGNQAI